MKKLFKIKTDINTVLYKCSRGNTRAQERLYKMHYSYALSIALRFSNNRESASEILNDSFLKTFQFLIEGGEIKDFLPWLRKIIINKAIDSYRSEKRNKKIITIEENLPDVILYDSVISTLSAEEILTQIQKLPDIYRLVFILYEIEGYSHKEISEKLDISETASRKDLSRAKSQLKILLQKTGIYEQV